MKVSRRDAQSGAVRWLLRICGWGAVVVGIIILVIPKNPQLPSYYRMANPLIPGIILVILDLLLPDPARKARKMRKKLEKLYNAVYDALPSNAAVFDLAKRTSGSPNLELQIQMYSHSAKALFQKAPVKETLAYIYNLNPQASYEICFDIVKASNHQPNRS